MTYTALALAFLAGAMAINTLARWVIGLGWRANAAFAAAAAVASVLMVAL